MAFNEHGLELPTAARATAIITFTGAAQEDETIQITSFNTNTTTTQKTYTAKNSTSASDLEFRLGAQATTAAAALSAADGWRRRQHGR